LRGQDDNPLANNDFKKLKDLCNSVFVYENGPEGGANGVVNLLNELPAQHGPQEADFHNLRLEFLKRVFWGHLQDMMIFEDLIF
jgi:hypothetical protein